MSTTYSKATLIGYLGGDPETRALPSGDTLCTFRVAVNEKARGGTEERTSWYSVSAFGKLGEICAEYMRKGSLVFVEGSLSLRPYTDRKGVERISVDVRANEVRTLDRRAAEGEGAPPTVGSDMGADAPAWNEDVVPF